MSNYRSYIEGHIFNRVSFSFVLPTIDLKMSALKRVFGFIIYYFIFLGYNIGTSVLSSCWETCNLQHLTTSSPNMCIISHLNLIKGDGYVAKHALSLIFTKLLLWRNRETASEFQFLLQNQGSIDILAYIISKPSTC